MPKPLCVELFCGTFGWSAGWLELGGQAIGFDIQHLPHHGAVPCGAELVLQDVRTLHGRQFRDADLILASPPCQEYSYVAMPWSRGKQIAAALRGRGEFPKGYTGSLTIPELNALFDACFRIQREASEAAGRYIPMVVENVKGAQPWVGRAAWHYGSFYLWGDVPALMPFTQRGRMKSRIPATGKRFDERMATTPEEAHALHYRLPGGQKNGGGSWFNVGSPGQTNVGQNPVTGVKVPGFNFHEHEKTGLPGRSFQSASVDGTNGFTKRFEDMPMAWLSSKSNARKAASAQIAKIPFELSRHIAHVYKPQREHEHRVNQVGAANVLQNLRNL